MLEYLQDIDEATLLIVNGWHCPFTDDLWWLVSLKWAWLLIIGTFAWIVVRNHRHQVVIITVMIVLTVLLADQISSTLIKDLVERLRPTHDPSLANVIHTVNDYRGGMYGFVSSHAANSTASAMLITLLVRHRAAALSMFLWAILQCYSRIYLGVHYPGDIVGGVLIGLLVGWLVWALWRWLCQCWHIRNVHFSVAESRSIALSVTVTIAIITVTALLQQL